MTNLLRQKKVYPFFWALLWVLLTQGFAGADAEWEFAGWYGGGCYPGVEFDLNTPNRVYLASDVAGIWRSDDLGENWRFVTRGLGSVKVFVLAVAPSDPHVIYAGTDKGVFYSSDSAENWLAADSVKGRIHFSRPENYRSLVVSKTNPAEVIAGSSAGEVFYSNDFGKRWKTLGDRRPFGKTGPITALAWLEKEKVLYASSAQGMARYSFENARWIFLRNSPKNITDFLAGSVFGHTLYAAGQNRISFSDDAGWTWKTGESITQGKLFRLLAPGRDKKTMFAAWNDDWKGGVLRSKDAGQHWEVWDTQMNADILSNPTRVWAGVHGRINSLKEDPFKPNVLFRTDWWGVWRSDDGGVSWNEKIKGAPNTVMTDIAISQNGEIYASSMDDGLLKSSDAGKTYQALFPAGGYADDVNGHVWSVRLLGEKIIATSSPWGVDFEQVIVSTDGGANFGKSHKGLPNRRPKIQTVWHRGFARALAVHPDEPDTIYLGIDGNDGGGFFISKDAGISWRRPERQPGSLKIYNGLAVDPQNVRRILWGASGKAGGVYLSEDAGESWRLTDFQMKTVHDVIFGVGSYAYASGEENGSPAIYVSKDAGRQWKLMKKFETKGFVKGLCALPDGRVAAGIVSWHGRFNGKIYLASADGKNWEDITGDLPPGEGPAALTYHPLEKALYVARFAGCIYKKKVLIRS